MSKIKKVFSMVLFVLFSFLIPLGSFSTRAYAENGVHNIDEQQIKQDLQTELELLVESGVSQDLKERDFRVPGSKEEYKTAVYIYERMQGLSNFLPVNDGATIDGIQSFNFESNVSGNNETSHNIIFRKESSGDKKVVLCAHYDSKYVYKVEENPDTGKNQKVEVINDGINDNAGSVALLLTLAKNLDLVAFDIGFDIEIVFFGAGTDDYAGSKFYNQGKTNEDCEKTLLVINFDKIVVGDYIYTYVNEFKTPQETYFNKFLKGEDFKELKNINAVEVSSSSVNGLSYTHIGLQSDHSVFMERNVNVLNFFSGNYENPLTFGYNEKENGKNVTYTENDSYSYILTNYPQIYDRLFDVYEGVDKILFDSNFVVQMEKPNNLEEKYEFWTNEKLAVLITLILLFVFAFVYFVIYHNLLKKSAKRATENVIEKLVIKISSNMEEGNKEITDLIDDKINRDIDKKDKE